MAARQMFRHILTACLFICAAIALTVPCTLALNPPAAQTASTAADPAVAQLHSANPKQRRKAADDIAKNGAISDIPALVGALNDPDESVRAHVVLALASFRTPQAMDGLIKATQDTSDEVRTVAVEGIVGYYTGQTPSSGFISFIENQYKKVKQHFVPDTTRLDPGAAVDPRAVKALEAVMLDTRYKDASHEATRALGIIGNKLAVPDLVRTAHSPDEDLALEALNSLMKIKDPSAGPELMDLLDSSDNTIQRHAAITVGFLRTSQAVPQLQSLYTNGPNRETRQAALTGLAYIGDPISVAIFLKAIWSPDKQVRIDGAEGLGRAGDVSAIPDLLKRVVIEKDAGVKMAMEFGLLSLGNSDYLSQMIENLRSGSRGQQAQDYLAELAHDSSFLPRLYPFLNSRDAQIRVRLCNVLMYSGNQTSIAPLESASHDSNADVAAAAIRALRAVRSRVSASAS